LVLAVPLFPTGQTPLLGTSPQLVEVLAGLGLFQAVTADQAAVHLTRQPEPRLRVKAMLVEENQMLPANGPGVVVALDRRLMTIAQVVPGVMVALA
jgi:hypothetical protein